MSFLRASHRPLLGAAAALALAACGDPGTGGLTASVIFEPHPGLGLQRQALRTAAVPEVIGRLQIAALDADGSTLAETNLWASAMAGQLPLIHGGGTWELTKVTAGSNRVLVAKAYLGGAFGPGLEGEIAFQGRLEGLTVSPGEITNAGELRLRPVPVRIPELDFDAPDPPASIEIAALPEGEALQVTVGEASQEDVAGYVLAVGTSTAVQGAGPQLERRARFVPGDVLAPGVVVAAVRVGRGGLTATLEGLTDGVPYTVLAYAYDGDGRGGPLNYSIPAQASAVPQDTLPPGRIQGFAAEATATGISAELVAPGEDGDGDTTGLPAAYELRAARTRAELEDADSFARLPAVRPPPVATPRSTVRFERTWAEVGLSPPPFFLGVRAVDRAENAGPISIAEVAQSATVTPMLAAVVPNIALAGREVVLHGVGFGEARGTVRLHATETSTETVDLSVTRWTDLEVVVSLPLTARTGRIELRRADGPAVEGFLVVVLRRDDQLDDHEFPFELIGTGGEVAALYREANDFPPFEAAIDRLFAGQSEGIGFAPFNQNGRSTAVGGAYSPGRQTFLFFASNQASSMTAALVSSSTVAPNPTRVPIAVLAGGADSLAVAILGGGPANEVPAMLAFTRQGVLRTATVADARLDLFEAFYATTSTVESYDRVRMVQGASGELLLGHRTVSTSSTVLTLWQNPGGRDPSAFVPVPAAAPPEMGERLELLALPGTPQRYVIAYEAREPGGRTDVRLLALEDYGARAGYAPFEPVAGSRRLEDVGLVTRRGEVWLAVLGSQVAGTATLSYTEVPLSALTDAALPRGSHPGVVLDIAPSDTRARAGCKPFVQAACPMVWMGDDAEVLFLRR